MRLFGFLTVAVLAVSLAAPAGAKLPTSGWPVHVENCDPQLNPTLGYAPGFYAGPRFFWRDVYGYRFYEPPFGSASPTLNIAYMNRTQDPIKQIDFGLVANGRLVAEVRDVGTFSPGATIQHAFGLSPNVFPLQTALARCVPLRVTYADGRVWRNPHLPALRRSIYNNP